MQTDTALITKYVRGDDRAFAEIVQRYHHSLWWTARRHVTCDLDAQDILQEAYLRAALGLHHYRSEASLKTWLHQLVRNASYDYKRPRYREEIALIDDTGADIPHPTYDPLAALELTLTLASILDRLSEQQRAILIMVDILGHTIYQTADNLGMTSGTLKSRRSRAKRFIRRHHPELVGM